MSGIRIGGLVSGLDTQSIIDSVLELEAKKITTVQDKKADLEEDVAAWMDVSGDMTTLTEALDALRGYDTWNKMSAVSSDETVATALASSGAHTATYRISVSELAQAHTIASERASDLGVADTDTDLIGSGVLSAGDTFTIEGVSFTIGADEHGQTVEGEETLNTLRKKINEAASTMDNDVYASILDNRLVIQRGETGASELSMSEDSGTPLQALGLFSAADTFNAPNVMQAANDAVFTVNGATVTRSSNADLTDVIENVTLNLLNTTSGTDTVLDVERDIEEPKNAVLAFVEAYNVAIKHLENVSFVEVSGDGDPLTGELYGDSMIPGMKNSMRRLATDLKYSHMPDASYTYKDRTGNLDSLEDIGVWTTGKENVLEIVDEDRLDYLLANNFDEVEQMFRGVYEEGEGYTNGVASDLYDYAYGVSTPLTGEIARRITRLQTQTLEADESIEKLLDGLDDTEASLWRDFGVMENAMAKMQSESSWLTSQLGSK
jgi:flagellar hook-associated protein 2